jgi:hypothetical protein
LGVGRGWEVCGLRRGLRVGVGMQEQAPAESPFVMKQSTLASPEERTNSRGEDGQEKKETKKADGCGMDGLGVPRLLLRRSPCQP